MTATRAQGFKQRRGLAGLQLAVNVALRPSFTWACTTDAGLRKREREGVGEMPVCRNVWSASGLSRSTSISIDVGSATRGDPTVTVITSPAS